MYWGRGACVRLVVVYDSNVLLYCVYDCRPYCLFIFVSEVWFKGVFDDEGSVEPGQCFRVYYEVCSCRSEILFIYWFVWCVYERVWRIS